MDDKFGGVGPSNFAAMPTGPSAPPTAGPVMPGPAEMGQQPGALSGAGSAAGGMERPIVKAMPVEPPKKKVKKGLIIGLACGAVGLLLVIVGVVVLVMVLNQPDPVAEAMNKLVAAGLPANVHADATMSVQMTDQMRMVSHYKVTAKSDIMPAKLTNQTNLTVVMGGTAMEDKTFTVDEVFAGTEDLYFRFDGIYTALDEMEATRLRENGPDEEEELLCEDENGEMVVCDPELNGSEEGGVVEEGTGEEGAAEGENGAATIETPATRQIAETPGNAVAEGDEAVSAGDGADGGADVDSVDGGGGENGAAEGENGEATDGAESGGGASGNASGSGGATGKSGAESSKKRTATSSIIDEADMPGMLALAEVIDGRWVQITEGKSEEATGETDCVATAETDCVDVAPVPEEEAVEGEVVEGEVDGTVDGEEGAGAEAEGEEEVTTEVIDTTVYTGYLRRLVKDVGGRVAICVPELVTALRNNASRVAELYRTNPFLSGTTDGVTLTSSHYPVYRVVVDMEKYVSFVSGMQEAGMLGSYMKCAAETVTDVMNYPTILPEIYVEVDSMQNFSRIYFAGKTQAATLMLDLNLTYPEAAYVQQPQEFMTLPELTEELTLLEEELLAEE